MQGHGLAGLFGRSCCALFGLFSGVVVVVSPLEIIRSFTFMYICNYICVTSTI